MKIRKGFVSNSSSTSFLIYGSKVTQEDLKEEFYNELKNRINEEYESEEYDLAELDEFFDDYLYDLLKNEENRNEIDIYFDYEDRGCYIGKSLIKIKDDETGKEFKNKVEHILNKYFDDLEYNMIQETIYG